MLGILVYVNKPRHTYRNSLEVWPKTTPLSSLIEELSRMPRLMLPIAPPNAPLKVPLKGATLPPLSVPPSMPHSAPRLVVSHGATLAATQSCQYSIQLTISG